MRKVQSMVSGMYGKRGILYFLTMVFGGVLYLFPTAVSGQAGGYKYFKNYTAEEYDHLAQNWSIAQASSGMIYVANQGGLLEYDGVSWRIVGIPKYETIFSLAMDNHDTVYIGAKDKIGYLSRDEKGFLSYVSLLNYLKEEEKKFGDVRNILSTQDGIYFRTSDFLFRFQPDSKTFKTWAEPKSFRSTFVLNGQLFALRKGKGLMKLVKDSFQLLPGTETLEGERVYLMVPDPNNSQAWIIATKKKGFYRYDGQIVTRFPTEVDEYLLQNECNHIIQLSSGDFAIATLKGGLVIMTPDGRLKSIFDRKYGLQDNIVYHVFEDHQGNLWLSLSKGLAKIEYNSPLSLYDERSNLAGLVLAVTKHQGTIYAGTGAGLFQMDAADKFQPVPHVSNNCLSILSLDDSLLAATNGGVFLVEKDTASLLLEGHFFSLLASRIFPGQVWCGSDSGLVVLRREKGKWLAEPFVDIPNQEIRSMAEDKKGNVWLGTMTGTIYRISFTGGSTTPNQSEFNATHGLPEGEITVTSTMDHIVFTTPTGLYRFDETKNTFMPDGILGKPYAGGPDANPIFRLVEDTKGNIWFHSESLNHYAMQELGGSYKIDATPFRRIPTTAQANSIYLDPNDAVVWFATNDGLIRFDKKVKKNYSPSFNTLIRKIILNESQKTEKIFSNGLGNPTEKSPQNIFPTIDYKDRSILFQFAAPFFEPENKTKYQFFLEGYDDDWSNWDLKTQRNYPNLSPGFYKFRVRATNIFEQLGQEGIFQFQILRPWYLTWWAYLLYASIFFLMSYLIYNWRHTARLEVEKKKLENLVTERTKEIQEKNIILNQQSEKLKEMDRVKSRFFANISHEFRTPLTLIISPLEQMILDFRDNKQKKKLRGVVRHSRRLHTLIDQLLELAKFDGGHVQLRANCQNIVAYLKELLKSFEVLARQSHVELEFHSIQEDIPLFFDAPKLEEVMYNLLGNAFKFTPPGGKITVAVTIAQRPADQVGEKDRNYVLLSVKDTGIGVPHEQIKRIFDPFFQAENIDASKPGTGIGLSLAKDIVLLHHGTIDVHSQEGQGTEFEIRLLMGQDHFSPNECIVTPAISSNQNRKKELESMCCPEDEECEEDKEPETAELNDETTEKPTILVVEDHAEVRQCIGEPLSEIYNVIEATNGQEGIDKAIEFCPDIIISDVMMPVKDGYSLCKELKKDIRTSHIPIILLTAKAAEENVLEGLDIGANDYIMKPFNIQILLSRIKNLLDLRAQTFLKLQRENMQMPSEVPVTSLDAVFLQKFQAIVDKNFTDSEFRVEAIYEELAMGRSTLFKKLKALTEQNPNQFIMNYRLERGAQLLRDNFGNVTEVAMAVGFSDSSYFAKCFKEKFKVPPTSYQDSVQEPS